MTDTDNDRRDVALLTIALDHAMRWLEFRITNGLQVLNFFLLAAAVMSAAYVSAINGRLHAVAGVIALLGVAAAGAAYFVGKRQREVAQLAHAPGLRRVPRLSGFA
jgi:steroid 5-alpha reductase family enzyme